ncbi:MAG: hypothetical protein FD149_633 [Rhodospirillaceae bacterium]|nr:MAG: hypothetical protein FD149_633 [Rhodospirillaceae bacterium]
MSTGGPHGLARWAAAPDEAIDLAEAALELAALEVPGASLIPYRFHLAEIADHMRSGAALISAHLDEYITLLTETVHGTFGYRGAVSRGESHVTLMCTIERRQGTPVTLGILYLHAARAAGWAATGLTFPGRFLVRVQTAHGQRAVLDPFAKGEPLTSRRMRRLLKEALGPTAELTQAHYQPLNNRETLLRLQDDLKTQSLQAGRFDAALEVLETMLLLAPDAPALWREAGMIHRRLGHVAAAVSALERFLSLAPDSPVRCRTAELLNELYGRL